jgi:hypothetical protein
VFRGSNNELQLGVLTRTGMGSFASARVVVCNSHSTEQKYPTGVYWKRINAMVTLKTEEEEILTFDVSDEALEIAGTDKTNFTWGVCTLDQPGCFPSTDDGRP